MKRTGTSGPVRWFIVACVWSVAIGGGMAAAETAAPRTAHTIGIVTDFASEPAGPYQKGYLEFSRWPEEHRRKAESFSRLEIVTDPVSGKKVLRIRILDAALFAYGAIPLVRLAPFFPPETDGIRLQARAASGRLFAYLGGPTAYYANSDVFTETRELPAEGKERWASLDFNLLHPLRRNFRRAGFSTDTTRIYYHRWAQEPTGLFLAPGTSGEIFIERIELTGRGDGRAFPVFSTAEVHTVKTISDFESGRKDGVFNLYMADGETEWFEESWKRERPLRFTPAKTEILDDSTRGAKTLVCTGPTAEEVHCTGIRTDGAPAANALRYTLLHDAPGYRNTVVGMGRAEAVDFLVFVAPPGKPFPWQEFEPSPELRNHPGPGFDYQMSYRVIRDRQNVDFAVYQARRYLRPREWTTLVIPADDFVCIYGSGAYRNRFLRNEALTCGDVMAVAWLHPWCRLGRGDITLKMDDLAFVQVPSQPERQRSFWQLNSAETVQWIDERTPRGPMRYMLLPGDSRPALDESSRP